MGPCQSSPTEAVVSTSSKASKGTVLESKESTPTLPPEGHPANSKHDYHSDGSSEGKTAEMSVTHASSPKTPVTSTEEEKRSAARRGYSSGGSSDFSDECNLSAHNHLVGWKNELASNGELTSAVVHIEVSQNKQARLGSKWYHAIADTTFCFRLIMEDQ
jgi:hypothetical protein